MAGTARVIGFLLLVPLGLLYLVSGLVVPMPWLIGMWALFVVFVAFAVRNRHEPWRVLATPVVGVVTWFAVVSLGGALLDWTA